MADITLNQSDIEKGEDILLSLIYPKTVGDMTAEQAAEFTLAAGEQAEYAAGSGGAVKQESVGDVSVTYADVRAVNMYGERISPSALARLQKCGLLCRWI